MLEKQLCDQIIDRLKSVFPLKIFLFGSYAYGNPNRDSDIDLLVVKDVVSSKMKEMNEARAKLLGIHHPFDILVVSKPEFEFYKAQTGSIYREINTKGMLLYAA